MAKVVYVRAEELAFFSFGVSPISFKNVKTCRSRVMCLSGDLENMSISSRYTSVNCHSTEDDLVSLKYWNVLGTFIRQNSIQMNRNNLWWDAKAA